MARTAAEVAETALLGELVLRARAAGVQAMVEGPGHLALDQVMANVTLEKRLCHGAPFYVLGPLVTDLAPGYDHITGAIGGALAGMAGADFLCYVTPAEHLGLPTVEEVHAGVIASRIAAHAADVVRLGAKARCGRRHDGPRPRGAGLGGPIRDGARSPARTQPPPGERRRREDLLDVRAVLRVRAAQFGDCCRIARRHRISPEVNTAIRGLSPN